ncbi:MAG: hypothetical protein CR997_01595 [Acidobacteria bacterium]|nr:MAG: hypothetical protein CR997_01595 [Acidobacteriota bacterium]
MKSTISFHRPESLHEAVCLKREKGHLAAYISGGTFINSSDHPQEYEHLIYLENIVSNTLSQRKDKFEIGANCTFQQLIDFPGCPQILAESALLISSRNIRNRATLGGHLASRLSRGALLPALLALNTTVHGVEQELSLEAYLNAENDLLLTQLTLPLHSISRAAGLSFYRSSTIRSCSLIVAALSSVDEACFTKCRIGIGGTVTRAMLLPQTAGAVNGLSCRDDMALNRRINNSVQSEPELQGLDSFHSHMLAELIFQAVKKSVEVSP